MRRSCLVLLILILAPIKILGSSLGELPVDGSGGCTYGGECGYTEDFETVEQARITLSDYIHFYNNKRFHQALNYHTPSMVYELGFVPTKQQLFEQFAF